MKQTILIVLVFKSIIAFAQPGQVLSSKRISYKVGGLNIPPDSMRGLGWNTCYLGDLDNDGRTEIFTTSPNGLGFGYLISLNSNGTVYTYNMIGKGMGLPINATPTWSSFGSSCANVGDIDKDGITDLAIGNNGGGGYCGDIIIVFLNANGSVKNYKNISAGKNGFNATLGSKDHFGESIASIGDIDNNRTIELIIGAPYTNDGNTESGAIWILSIDSTGFCTNYGKISHTSGGGSIMNLNQPFGRFGKSLAKYMDIDGDDIPEFFVGRPYSNYNNQIQGVFYAVSINQNKTIKSFKLISDTSQNFGDTLTNPCFLSESIGNIGDIDGNGFEDIIIGSSSNGQTGAYFGRGSIRMLLMEEKFKIKSNVLWDSLQNGIPAFNHDQGFGLGLTGIGDINKDGKLDAIVGLPLDYRDANLYGSMFVLFLDGKKYPSSTHQIEHNSDLKVFPNPISKGQTIQIVIPEYISYDALKIQIVNSLGQEVYNYSYNVSGESIFLDGLDLSSGIYTVSVFYENKFYKTKLIVD